MAAAVDVFPTGDALEPVKPPHPSTFSHADLGRILETADVVETWLAAVREYALDQAKQGKAIPGRKLVEKIANRKWVNEGKAFGALKAHGIDPFTEPKIVSPAEADRRLGKGGKTITAGLTHRPVTGVKLVDEKNKAPALDHPGRVFGAIE